MDFAYSLGATVVVNQVGRVPDDPDDQQWATMLEALHDIGRHSQLCGATLAAETGSESGSDLKRLIDALPDGSIGVTFDPGNLIVNGHSASDALPLFASHVLHVQARDGVRDLARGRGLEVTLGRGSVDFPELLGTLEDAGYRGYYTIVRDASNDPVREIGDAIMYLKQLNG